MDIFGNLMGHMWKSDGTILIEFYSNAKIFLDLYLFWGLVIWNFVSKTNDMA